MPHLDETAAVRAVQDFSWALPARILLQLNMPRLDSSVNHFQSPDCAWEVEPLWARRARIEEQRLAEPFGFRLVGMAKHADVWLVFLEERSSILRELPAFVQNMTDGDAAACRFDHGLWWRPPLFEPVDIAGGHCDRGSALSLIFRMPNPWSSLSRRWSVLEKGFLHPHNPTRSASAWRSRSEVHNSHPVSRADASRCASIHPSPWPYSR
jgi:hypothetical protein